MINPMWEKKILNFDWTESKERRILHQKKESIAKQKPKTVGKGEVELSAHCNVNDVIIIPS